MRIMLMAATAVSLTFAAPAAAADVLIDFEDLGLAQSVTNQYAAQGVTFSTVSAGGAVSNAATFFTLFNGAFTQMVTNTTDGGGQIANRRRFMVLDFSGPVSNLSFDYNNIGGLFSANNFRAFDGQGNLLETRAPTEASNFAFEAIAFTSTGISQLRLEAPSDTWVFGLDNLRFTTANVAAVPEPSTWALLIAGFGLVGGSMRRAPRRTAAVSYA
jgi:hypothetical protein